MAMLCCSPYGHNLTNKHMPDKVTDSQICNWQTLEMTNLDQTMSVTGHYIIKTTKLLIKNIIKLLITSIDQLALVSGQLYMYNL